MKKKKGKYRCSMEKGEQFFLLRLLTDNIICTHGFFPRESFNTKNKSKKPHRTSGDAV